MEDKIVFVVKVVNLDLPRPSNVMMFSNTPFHTQIYVVARDYSEAIMKANMKIESIVQEQKKQPNNILDADGSLKYGVVNLDKKEPRIVGIDIFDEIFVW